MSAGGYGERVRECFAAPRHAGRMAGAISVYAAGQGMRLCLYALSSRERIDALRFQAFGCPHFIAASEWFCREFEGRAVASLLDFSAGDLMTSLAVPVEKTGRILVLEDAVRALGQELRVANSQD